jgi:hypothetical protein
MDRCPGCGGPLPSSPWDDQQPAYCRRCRRGDAPTDTVHVVWNCPDCGTGYRGQAFAERCCDGGTFAYDTTDADLRADGGENESVMDYLLDPAEGTELHFWAEEGRVSQPSHSNIQALFSPDGRYRLTVEVGDSDGVEFPGYRIQLHAGPGDGTFLYSERRRLANVVVPQYLVAEVADYLARRVAVLEDLHDAENDDPAALHGGDA